MRNGFTFEGFEPANTTPVPDFLFDVLLAHLSEAELKVLLYIIRRTNGFKKPADAISLTQFQKGIRKRATGEILDEGCGVADRATIIRALASLEKKGCIQCEKNHDTAGDKATTVYRVRFRSEGVVGNSNHPDEIGSGKFQPPWYAKPTTGSGQNQLRVVGKSNLQETVIQDTDSQETVRQEGTYGANAPTPAHALFVHPEYDFLAFDDLQHPTLMVIYFVDDERAEVTNKARGWTAQGVVETLSSQGIHLEVRKEKEHHSSTVNAPTPAHLLKDVNEKLEEVEELQRITGEHPAVHATDTESHYHIASDIAIGNEERVIMPALRLPSIGATHAQAIPPARLSRGSDRGSDRVAGSGTANRPVEHAPGTAALPPAAAVADTVGRSSGISSVQAISAPLVPLPAQAGTSPPAGSMEPAPTAQASGRRRTVPKRPIASAPILSPNEQTVIDLWSEAMHKTYPLTDGLIKAAKLLAPCKPSVEDLKAVRGFCFASNPEWFAKQRKGAVTLLDIAKNWEGWQSSLEQPQEKQQGPPVDKYTAASRDKARSERNMQRLRDMIIADGGELPK